MFSPKNFLLSISFTIVIVSAVLIFFSTTATTFINAIEEDDADSFTVVGARVITCAGCKLNSLPRVRQFLENEARSYPALHIEYHEGRDPEIQFLDKHKNIVSTHDLSPLSPLQIAQLLNNNNIHTWTQAPNYEAPEFHETEYCVAFRQTAECSPLGPREQDQDSPCLTFVDESRSGYCQCKNGRPNVEMACGHEADTCEKLCAPEGEGQEIATPKPPNDDF